MISITPFLGRTYDVLAWRNVNPPGMHLAQQDLLDVTKAGEVCTGIQKLAQRYLCLLLLEKGSFLPNPELGTDLLANLFSGSVRTVTDVRSAFALAETQLRTQLWKEESETDFPDERYRSSKLLQVVLQPTVVSLHIQLNSLASSWTFIAPIPVVPE